MIMSSNIKYIVYALLGLVLVYTLMTDKDGGGSATADLDRVLGVASDSMAKFENSSDDINKENVMEKFSSSYASNLNSAQPAIHSGPIGVKPQADGSLAGFDDSNNNQIKDTGEKDLFTLEVDDQNKRLVASSEGEVREQGFSFSGLFMGMMIGNMLSRQRATGTNPAAKRATPRRASAKSRSGSGSHSKGK